MVLHETSMKNLYAPVTLGPKPWKADVFVIEHRQDEWAAPVFGTKQDALAWAEKRCDELNQQVSNG